MFTAIFLGCLAVSAIIVTLGVISDATGADMPGYVQPAPVSVAVPPAVVDPVVMSTEKKDLTPNGESIIGLRDPSLTVNSTAALVVTMQDYTTYGDRAIIKLTNATGSSIDLTGMCIKGKPVVQLAGQNGYVWEYSDYDSIEKEGEQFVEVSNDFIFDPVQAKQIGDFVWKELKPHKLYSLMLVGCQYQYEIGDVYHLTLTHTMNGGTMENIDTDVEVMGVSINRSVGGVGMTNLNLRVPSEAWALTLAKNSKLVGAGNAQRLNNRSNVVTVAASTWTGQADYFCDGTDDNVEIQAAIDYVESLGGGEVLLTSGYFYSSDVIYAKSKIKISGSGRNTNIYKNIFTGGVINATSISEVSISYLNIYNNTTNTSGLIQIYSSSIISISNVYLYCTDKASGIFSDSSSIIINIDDCVIIEATSGVQSVGTLTSLSRTTVRDCTFAITLAGSSTVFSCFTYNNSIDGIKSQGDNSVFSHNISYSNNRGIFIVSGSNNNIVVGNRCYSNTTNFLDSGTGTINSGNLFV